MVDTAETILKRHDALKGNRANWESHWQEIAERVLPRQAIFQRQGSITQGEKRTEKIFDATASLALDRFAAALESLLTPRTQRWHKLGPADQRLKDNRNVQVYLDEVTEILFEARYSPRANFASQAHETYMGLGAFGTAALFVDEMIGQSLRYRAIHLAELYIAENHQGQIDTIHREFPLTARQAVDQFGDEKLPPKIVQAATERPDQEFDFIHCVKPRKDIQSNRRDHHAMPLASYHVSIEGRQIIDIGGYWTFPYPVSRYVTAPREIYGRSPAMLVLPDVKMLNEMSKTVLRAAHKIVDPPILLQDDGALQGFQARPGSLNFGGVDEQGRQLAHPFITNARVDIGLDMMEQRRKVINDAFLVTLFQILVETPNMTATEALLRAQEKGALLAPTMGRQQSEMLGPLIEREIDILARAGQLPPMPPELEESGGQYRIEYVSPLNRLQRAEDGVAILRTLENLAPLAAVDPTVLDIFHPERTGRELADINGAPVKVMRSPEELEALRTERARLEQAKLLIQAAPGAAKAAKDAVQAQATAQNIPAPIQ